MANRASDPIDRQYKAMIEGTYNPIPRNDTEKIIDNLLTLIEMGHDKKQSVKNVLESAVKIIFKHFDYHDITVGLKNRTDGYYRYEVFFGFRKDLEESMRKVKYDYDDMVSNEKFPFIKIGRISELDPVEGLPEWEKDWYKPYAIGIKRKTPDEFHEGDYIDIWMYSNNRDLIGWFEIANPLNGKLPSRDQLRWMELIVSICTSIVVLKWAEEDIAKGKPPMQEMRIRPR